MINGGIAVVQIFAAIRADSVIPAVNVLSVGSQNFLRSLNCAGKNTDFEPNAKWHWNKPVDGFNFSRGMCVNNLSPAAEDVRNGFLPGRPVKRLIPRAKNFHLVNRIVHYLSSNIGRNNIYCSILLPFIHEMMMNFVTALLGFILMHILVWYGSNAQFILSNQKKSVLLSLALSLPISLLALYSTRSSYAAFESLWATRMFAFGTSYLIFPVLTWWHMGESPFNVKTAISILLSCVLVFIQVFWKNI